MEALRNKVKDEEQVRDTGGVKRRDRTCGKAVESRTHIVGE